jgi:hypothetical protein
MKQLFRGNALAEISQIPGVVCDFDHLLASSPKGFARDWPPIAPRRERRTSRPAKPTAAPDSRQAKANIATGASATIYDPALD